MTSKKNLLIALLALSTVASGVFAWQQYQRAQRTGTQVAAANQDDLLKKLHDAQRHAADLEARLAALQSSGNPSGEEAPAENAADDRRGGPQNRNGRDNNARRAEFAALMNTPEMQQLRAAQQKNALDARYAALFKQLNLSPDKLEAFKNLLLEKQNSRRDVMDAASDQGLNRRESRDELRKLIEQTDAEIESSIAAAIGQDAYSQYKTYDSTGNQRALVDQFSRSLSYGTSPLSDAQSQALVQILASSSSQNTEGGNRDGGRFNGGFAFGGGVGGPGGGFIPGGGGGRVTITDDVISQAQNVLSPSQVKALQELQATQKAEQKVREVMRAQNEQRRAQTQTATTAR